MSDQDATVPPQVTGYYLCDLARTTQEFSIIDVEKKEVTEVESEEEARLIVTETWPDARFVLASGKSAVEGQVLGNFVVIAVLRQAAAGQPWQAVAYVGGAVHGSLCVPFTPEVWPDAVDTIGISTVLSRSATDPSVLRTANASWRALESPHPFREKPPGVEWPIGPREETCADCGTDPRNTIHREAVTK